MHPLQMCYPSSGVLSECELLSVDSLLAIVNELYSHCEIDATGSHDNTTGSHDHNTNSEPTPEDLLLLRQRKKVKYNQKP